MALSAEQLLRLPQRLPAEPVQCAQHGSYMATGTRLPSGSVIRARCPACLAEEDRQAQAKAQEKAAAASAAEWEKMLGAAMIPKRFVGRSFDNFRAETPQQMRALTVARSYAEDFATHAERGEGLVFSGLPGTGKSHLAAAILQHLLPRSVAYVTCMGLIRSVRDTWRRDSDVSEREVLRQMGDLELLVIDEVGVQYGTDGEQTILFEVMDRRYRDVRPTVLLTNQGVDGFKTFVGERVFDRLTESSKWVKFDWPSHRAQARKDAQA